MTTIRPANSQDFETVLALNDAAVELTSQLDRAGLVRLHNQSVYHRVVEEAGDVVGFLLALRDSADYESPNYAWFSDSLGEFLYIDRIVIAQSRRGAGLGRRLYDDLFAFARDAGFPRIACEFNVEPLNEPSRRFHERYGFEEVGTQWVNGATKRVSMQVCRLA